jgi:hypothetical protein
VFDIDPDGRDLKAGLSNDISGRRGSDGSGISGFAPGTRVVFIDRAAVSS